VRHERDHGAHGIAAGAHGDEVDAGRRRRPAARGETRCLVGGQRERGLADGEAERGQPRHEVVADGVVRGGAGGVRACGDDAHVGHRARRGERVGGCARRARRGRPRGDAAQQRRADEGGDEGAPPRGALGGHRDRDHETPRTGSVGEGARPVRTRAAARGRARRSTRLGGGGA
jgi:hypothetical protein